MNIRNIYIPVLLLTVFFFACSRENEDLILPLSLENFPQIILFDDEEGGELEDSDELKVSIILAERYDPTGEELEGVIVPLTTDYTLRFEITDVEGIASLSNYVIGLEAYYEIDDCTTSLDEGVDILLSYNINTGIGEVRFPAGVEEIILEFELDEDYLNDDELNEERGFVIELSGVNEVEGIRVFNQPFEFTVLDDEAIFGSYSFDFEDAEAFESFKALFGLVNPAIADLSPDDIDEIEWSFEFDELKIEIVLKETESVEECGEIEDENLVIEIEADYEELTTDDTEGEIEVEGSVEMENGSEEDFVYSGTFKINGSTLEITLVGEFDGDETEEITLILSK
ncbi:MAG: hypothetical protein ACFCUU_10105 [Cyclobacteriaceae bacterium]